MPTTDTCPTCGEEGRDAAGKCPGCGSPLVESPPPAGQSASDDLILSWLALEPCPASPGPVVEDASCPSCGYAGAMIIDEGHSLRPACLGRLPDPLDEGVRGTIDCPGCDSEIKLRDGDRNKTIVCPRCKFFLGCVYRDAPSRQLEVFGVHLPSLFGARPSKHSARG
jgi:hypothetical protein